VEQPKFNTIAGKAHKYGDNIDTDVIIPGRYCNMTDPKALAKHCFEDLDINFVKKVSQNDIVVAGENFGCGSSREVAAVTLKAAGVSAVIAKSFARIFFRNSINLGLPIIECPEFVENTDSNDSVEIDLSAGQIRNLTKNATFTFAPYNAELTDIFNAGGLIPWLKKQTKHENSND